MNKETYWKACLVGSGVQAGGGTGRVARLTPVTGWTLEHMMMHACMDALVMIADGCQDVHVTEITCVCNACNGGGRSVKRIKGHDTPVNCPRCKGKGNFELRENVQIQIPEGVTIKRKSILKKAKKNS